MFERGSCLCALWRTPCPKETTGPRLFTVVKSCWAEVILLVYHWCEKTQFCAPWVRSGGVDHQSMQLSLGWCSVDLILTRGWLVKYVWKLLHFRHNLLVLMFTLICLFQLFASVCDKRKHQAFVILLIAAMSVQGIANLKGQFVSILQIRLLSLIKTESAPNWQTNFRFQHRKRTFYFSSLKFCFSKATIEVFIKKKKKEFKHYWSVFLTMKIYLLTCKIICRVKSLKTKKFRMLLTFPSTFVP